MDLSRPPGDLSMRERNLLAAERDFLWAGGDIWVGEVDFWGGEGGRGRSDFICGFRKDEAPLEHKDRRTAGATSTWTVESADRDADVEHARNHDVREHGHRCGRCRSGRNPPP